MVRRAAWLLLLAATSCAQLAGKKHYAEARRLEAAGDSDAAIEAYRRAVDASPGSDEYREALETASRAKAKDHAERARLLEKKERFGEAAAAWRRAASFDPRSSQLPLRVEVAEAKAKKDSYAIAVALKELVRVAPSDKSASKELERARADALVTLEAEADAKLGTGSATEAFEAFEKLKKLEPTHAVLSGAKYRAARARHFETIGDAKQRAGDGLGALEAYQEASKSAPIPGLEQKLARAKKSAGSLLEQLEQARAHERLEEWEDAAELYTLVRDRPDAPSDVADRARTARQNSARQRLGRAKENLRTGALDKARAELMLALEHTDGPDGEVERVTSGVSELASNRLSEARRILGEPLSIEAAQTAKLLLFETARASFSDAEKLAKNDPARAFLITQNLRPFAAELPKLAPLEASLKPKAFVALVARAEPLATMGAVGEAAGMIAAALAISRPPKELSERLANASLALTAGDSAKALDGFGEAARLDPRSKLADAGWRVARVARLAELQQTAKDPRAEPARIAGAWREILTLDPANAEAKAALVRLGPELMRRALASAQAQKSAGRLATALVYVERALSIDPEQPDAKTLREEISRTMPPADAVFASVAKLGKGPRECAEITAELRAALILYLTKTRGLVTTFLGPKEHAAIDEGRAPRALVELRVEPTECSLSIGTGHAEAKLALDIAGKTVLEGPASGDFDPSGLPKDEAAPAGPELAKATSAALARAVAEAVAKATPKLSAWRAVWARQVMGSDDVEGSSRAFLALRSATIAEEISARRDLDSYLARRLP
ncbi:MAG: hypothetical protein HYV07_00550 [Deltaproteobacteria bacterium]|nr:hypothetical protein [Deltaproteobacteria bacterium]